MHWFRLTSFSKVAAGLRLGMVVAAGGGGLLASSTGGVPGHEPDWQTPSSSSDADGPVQALVTFVPHDNGTINVTLTNQLSNPTSDGQNLSAVAFTLNHATGSGALATTNSGLISTIDTSDGSYTAGVADALTRWDASESGNTVSITTLTGGKPNRLIIGPDDHGGFNPTVGKYTNANSSIDQHNPSVLGSATFTITVPGVTSASTITGVSFQFGTTAGAEVIPAVVPVPEPASWVLAALGVMGLGLLAQAAQRAVTALPAVQPTRARNAHQLRLPWQLSPACRNDSAKADGPLSYPSQIGVRLAQAWPGRGPTSTPSFCGQRARLVAVGPA